MANAYGVEEEEALAYPCCLCGKAGEMVAGFVGDTPLVFCERCYFSFRKEGGESLSIGDSVLLRFDEVDCGVLKNRLVCWRVDDNGREPFVVEVEKVG